MLTGLTPRPYQAVLFHAAAAENTLVVLPTGLGKTAIALLLAARRAMLYPQSKILFVAPTKPLVEQHAATFRDHLLVSEDAIAIFTGSVPPAKRQRLWNDARFIFSTPQTIENDILANRIALDSVSLLVVDEAHRATGEYAYVFLAEEYAKQSSQQRILALTASPGTDAQGIKEIMANLHIDRIEYRKSTDPDVKEYVQDTDVRWLQVELPADVKRISAFLRRAFMARLREVQQDGFLSGELSSFSKVQLLKLQQQLHARAQQEQDPLLLASISRLAQSLKLLHALDLVETQTLGAFRHYAQSIVEHARSSPVKAFKKIAMDTDFISALAKARDCLDEGREHPKVDVLLQRLQSTLKSKSSAKLIVFTQFRDSAEVIAKRCADVGISHSLFFGQAKKRGKGFSQKKQKEVLDGFRASEFTCLIATSVAEEGLDIPAVDHVFFFEPVPSAIRTVQRRGRTGRHEKGLVSVLVAKGTKDETYRWVSHHKERRMYQVLESLRTQPSAERSQAKLQEFTPEQQGVSVIIDYREKGSPVMKALRNLGVRIELQQLSIGDYVVGPQACVEYKQYGDFLSSIVDGRLIAQLNQLKKYAKPLIILERNDESVHRRVDRTAIQGMLATIALSYRIPVLHSSSPLESAQLLFMLARREQEQSSQGFSFHNAKPYSDKELLEYIVSSMPGVGGVLAKSLLQRFDSLRDLATATVEEFQEIDKIGPKKAAELKRIFDQSYQKAKREHGLE